MNKRLVLGLSILLLVVFGFSAPARGDELAPAPVALEDLFELELSQEGAVVEEPVLSLEELTALFGAEKVCGINCGDVGQLNCTAMCGTGEPARCFSHHCIWM